MTSAAARLANLLRSPAPPLAGRPSSTAPAWLLLPGLAALLASTAVYLQYQRYFPAGPLDLGIYRKAIAAWQAGQPVYEMAFTLNLPYTYPPITLPLLSPLGGPDEEIANRILVSLSMTATLITAWFLTRLLGYHGLAGRLGLTGLITALAYWLEPYTMNLGLGQVNAVLMMLVVVDLALPDRNRLKGIGVGLATATKLVPGIFVLYLLLTRRFRAAATACGVFAAMTVAGWVISPAASNTYWLQGLFLNSSRVSGGNGPTFVANQSLHGFAVRTFGEGTAGRLVWVLSVLLVLAGGMALAAFAHRRGEEAAAVVTVAFTGLLASPISWSHHWVWVIVLIPLLVDITVRLRGRAQVVVAGLPVLVTMIFLAWPLRVRNDGPLEAHGFIWAAYRHGQPFHWLGEHMYVLAILALMLLAVFWLRGSGSANPPMERPPDVAGRPADNRDDLCDESVGHSIIQRPSLSGRGAAPG